MKKKNYTEKELVFENIIIIDKAKFALLQYM